MHGDSSVKALGSVTHLFVNSHRAVSSGRARHLRPVISEKCLSLPPNSNVRLLVLANNLLTGVQMTASRRSRSATKSKTGRRLASEQSPWVTAVLFYLTLAI